MRSPRCTVVVLRRVGVDEQHLELAAVLRVDEPGRVQAGDAVLEREARAGQHEPGVPGRDRDREPGRARAPGRHAGAQRRRPRGRARS